MRLGKSDYQIQMDPEYYNIDVELTVVETQNNMNNGNIYVDSIFHSYNPAQKPINYHGMATLEYKGSLTIFLKDVIKFIPFCSWFFHC